MRTDITWESQGHSIRISGEVEEGEMRNGRRTWWRSIWIDGELVAKSQGKDIMKAKYMAAEELSRIVRRKTLGIKLPHDG